MEDKLKQVVKNVFRVDDIEDTSSPETIPEWDSLGHLTLIHELEVQFGIQFTIDEISEMVNVRTIKEILRSHGVEI